ncbi:MAG: hypothetical protein H7X94_00005, partial [Vallitaleaceae bacterium]|nr:hypothetical protein [Vallitaleaceae bacterium]
MNLQKKKFLATLTCLVFICLLIGCTPKKTPSGDIYPSDLVIPTTLAVTTSEEVTTTDATDESTEAVISEEELEKITFNMDKLKDETYVTQSGNEGESSVWYTAAEELGII